PAELAGARLMSIRAVCPACRAVYAVADEYAGKKVRCKKCQGVFAPGAPARAPADDPPEAELVARPRPRPAPTAPAPRAPPRPPRREDGGDGGRGASRGRPRPPNNVPWVVGGLVGSAAVLVVGAITLALLLRGRPPAPTPVAAPGDPPAAPQPL